MPTSTVETFGERLRFDRKSESLTLSKLANLTGTTSSYLYKVERGLVKKPSFSIVERICRELGLSFSHILEFFTDPKERELDEEISRLETLLP